MASGSPGLEARAVKALYQRANAERWDVAESRFAAALEASAAKSLGDRVRDAREVARYLSALHVEDLALACACADGNEAAWDHFVAALRPVLYRSADALEPGGGAREVADALYAELFGLHERDGRRQSLFRYFHGRSSLATWLRAVLAQRFVDRIRSHRRTDPLPDGDESPAAGLSAPPPDPDQGRYLALMAAALTAAMGRLSDRDRLRMSLYYAQQLTLADVGRIFHEHEATVSRQLARARTAIRQDVERQLREESRLSPEEVERCFACVVMDSGTLDLRVLLGPAARVQEGERLIVPLNERIRTQDE